LADRRPIDNIANVLDNSPKPTVIYDDLPSDAPHGWKFLTVGPDNKLYIQYWSALQHLHALRQARADSPDQPRRQRRRGSRARHPSDRRYGLAPDAMKVLYFTENQRDWLSEDQPNDKLNRLLHPGQDNFGFPYCDGGDIPDSQFGWGHSCNEFTKPIAQLGPHSAPLGMRFYTGKMFPKEYHNAIFIARHGSWNKSKKIGGDVVVATLTPDGTVQVDRDVHHRLHPGQQLCRTARRHGMAEGRVDAAVR
jgi:glucose/arabinose dehydrogenase